MVEFEPVPGANYKHDYADLFRMVASGRISEERAVPTYREFCKTDLFFLLCFGLERPDVNNPWLVDRIREAEERHTDTMDLWAREHYKSTIFTYGMPIQELILNSEERIAIFSHTRPIAKGFLRQIKQTLESNVLVKRWFPDVFWPNPKKSAPKWSEDDGLIMKRKSHPKEASIEAWGLVDGQPTSKHFTIRIYDDVVTVESVTSPDMIRKNIRAFELSHSLGTDGGTKRLAGTHYHFADTYMHLRKKDIYHTRIYPATVDGTATGEPVFLSPARLAELRREQTGYIFACQQLLNPVADDERKFRLEWLKYYVQLPEKMNKYLLVDPANEKRKQSDYTTMGVIGIDEYGNRFLLDGLRDRLGLNERWQALKTMWSRNLPIQAVGYEKYGMQADTSYIEEKQQEEGVYFGITPLGGATSKIDRIERLEPYFRTGRFLLPHRLIYKEQDMVKVFIDEEYGVFPYAAHDDFLDMLARIEDPELGAVAPAGTAQVWDEGLRQEYIDARDVPGI